MRRLLIIAAGAAEAEPLHQALRYAPECRTIGFAQVTRPCTWIVRDARPDVVIVADPGTAEVALTRLQEARAEAPEATIICRSRSLEATWLQQVIEAGADAAIGIDVDSARFGLLVSEITAGTLVCVTRGVQQRPRQKPDEGAGLTSREMQILRLMASGATNGTIARQLWVTEQTVKFHLSNIYRKLGVANRTQASHFAHLHGLLDPQVAEPAGAPTLVAA